MDTKTVAIVCIIVIVLIATASLMIGLYRKEQVMKIFALSYACLALVIIISGAQAGTSSWLSPALINVLLMTSSLLLFIGTRLFYKEAIIWPKHYWLYILAVITVSIYFSAVHYSLEVRVTVLDTLAILYFIEFYFYIRKRSSGMPAFIKGAFLTLIIANIIFFAVNTVLIIIAAVSGDAFISHSTIMIYALLCYVVIVILSFTAIILLDNSKLLIEMQEKNAILESLAVTDKLTGLFNRNKLKQAINEYLELSSRLDKPISIIFFDIDNFKAVNDKYGHAAGDKVMIQVAEIVKDHVRVTDRAIRWGGDEFLILSIGTALDDAVILAQRIRSSIELHTFDSVEHVTASFGVIEHFDMEQWETWFKRADKALYEAKKSGRNRVVSSSAYEQLQITESEVL